MFEQITGLDPIATVLSLILFEFIPTALGVYFGLIFYNAKKNK